MSEASESTLPGAHSFDDDKEVEQHVPSTQGASRKRSRASEEPADSGNDDGEEDAEPAVGGPIGSTQDATSASPIVPAGALRVPLLRSAPPVPTKKSCKAAATWGGLVDVSSDEYALEPLSFRPFSHENLFIYQTTVVQG
jgi:hypothetical protein